MNAGPDIDRLLQAASGSGADGADLFAELYADLHRLARRQLSRHSGADLGATTLLHEAWLNMAHRKGTAFPDEGRFMAYAARVMRGLLIDNARHQHAEKNGGQVHITSFDSPGNDVAYSYGDLTRINDALESLAQFDPVLVEIVDLKFFCGFSFAEIAAFRSTSERTVQRQWEKARLFLHRALTPAAAAPTI